MVDACLLEYLDSTLAALPVGASKTDRLATEGKLLTNADIKVVLPVPAYPFNKNILLVLIDVAKSAIDPTISFEVMFCLLSHIFCSLVKVNGNFFSRFS